MKSPKKLWSRRIEFGHEQIKKICAAISELAKKAGKPKRVVEPVVTDEAYLGQLRSRIGERLADATNTEKHPKNESYSLIKQLKTEVKEAVPEEDEAGRKKAGKYFDLLREQIFREQVIKDKRRPDGREFDQIRDIWIEVGVLPRTHGSAIFTRGETQALVTTTLGTGEDMQRLEALRRRSQEALHAALQLPAVLGGRSGVPARRGPSRDWSRRTGRARAVRRAAQRHRLAVRDARRLRHSGVEWVVLDGHRLRRLAQH